VSHGVGEAWVVVELDRDNVLPTLTQTGERTTEEEENSQTEAKEDKVGPGEGEEGGGVPPLLTGPAREPWETNLSGWLQRNNYVEFIKSLTLRKVMRGT